LLGFDPISFQLLTFSQQSPTLWHSSQRGLFKPCLNRVQYKVCNWVLPIDSPQDYCLACDLNEMVPAITAPTKREWWANLETAKRRLLYTLLQLGLPVQNRKDNADGLAFAFLEDKRINPRVREEFVQTGHDQGLITVNLAEADDASRELQRVRMGESYRTLLGHFRHESGHYYFDRLIRNSDLIDPFRRLFGNEQNDYEKALQQYYNQAPQPAWKTGFISDYAQSHPLEDWAECWAHYLHIVDTLETAAEFKLVDALALQTEGDGWLMDWDRVTVILNALNRSMGMRDAYPFVYSPATIEKIRFVHSVLHPMRMTN
jgi:hypothetical protein